MIRVFLDKRELCIHNDINKIVSIVLQNKDRHILEAIFFNKLPDY